MSWAPLLSVVIPFLIVGIGAGLAGCRPSRYVPRYALCCCGIFAAFAALLLLVQLMMGFPVEDAIPEQMAKNTTRNQDVDAALLTAMTFETRPTVWPWVSWLLIAGSIPALVWGHWHDIHRDSRPYNLGISGTVGLWIVALLALGGGAAALYHIAGGKGPKEQKEEGANITLAQRSKLIEPMQTWAVSIDPPIRDQKITVVVTSPGAPVDVYVILENDPEEAGDLGSRALVDKKPIAGALATQKKTKNGTLEATIPANKGFSVVVNNPNQAKNADVKLKVTSKNRK